MNWGKGLFISMALFIVFIVGLGIYMVNNNDALYTDDYYQKGEAHTETMVAIENAHNVVVQYNNPSFVIDLGEDGIVELVEFKHMSNSKFDRTIRNKTVSARKSFTLDVPDLETGIWYIEVSGILNNKPFFKKHKLVM